MTRPSSRTRPKPSLSIDASEPSPWRRLTQVAFIIAVVVVITRVTTVESLRDPWDITPGSTPVPRGAGPAAGLVLDLLATIPALLVLARRSIDKEFRLAPRWSHLPMLLLGAWVMLSATWAADKFAAVVNASHFLAGLSLMWAVSQLVRSWVRLRIVSAVCFGLLLVLVAQSVMYRFVDVPADIRYWNEQRETLLKQRGWEPGSFSAVQFEKKITSGELAGFFTSPNTFAAVAVMLCVVSAGIGLQKVKDGDGPGWLAIPAIAAAGTIWILLGTHSKTAAATPVLGIAMLLAIAVFRAPLGRFAAVFYWLVVGIVALGFAAVIGHGLYHRGLFPGHFSNSLDFRWKYWTAAAQIHQEYPFRGVGWSNFGSYYVGVRLPEASEEVKDPHNFLVRFIVETGMIGGLLVIAWMLRMWWEMTRPANASTGEASTESCASATIGSVIAIGAIGVLLSIIVNIDFTQDAADVTLEMLRRLLYLLVLVLGAVAAAMRSPHHRELDDRPAPWLLYCVLVALGLFLIHNLIDFSLFEVGPMFTFLLLAGAALGVAPIVPSPARSRGWAAASLAVALIVWLIAAGALVVPVIAAEQSAFDANESIRTAPTDHPDQTARHFSVAAAQLRDAFSRVPYNSDYAIRAAKALLGSGQLVSADEMITVAQRANPMLIDAYLLQGNAELHQASPDAARVRQDFDTILHLNPNDVSLHKQYAEALERFGLTDAAREQYELALRYDAELPEGEPKRLTKEQVDDLNARIARLIASHGK